MTQHQKTGKRLVSKGEYVSKHIDRATEMMFGTIFLIIALFSTVGVACAGGYLLVVLLLANFCPDNLFAWVVAISGGGRLCFLYH